MIYNKMVLKEDQRYLFVLSQVFRKENFLQYRIVKRKKNGGNP